MSKPVAEAFVIVLELLNPATADPINVVSAVPCVLVYRYTCIHVYMCTYMCICVNCVLGYFAESQMLVWKVPGLARGHRHCLGGCRNRRGVHCRGRDGNTPRGNLLYMFDVCDLLHMTKDSFSNYLYCMLVKPLPPWPRLLT